MTSVRADAAIVVGSVRVQLSKRSTRRFQCCDSRQEGLGFFIRDSIPGVRGRMRQWVTIGGEVHTIATSIRGVRFRKVYS